MPNLHIHLAFDPSPEHLQALRSRIPNDVAVTTKGGVDEPVVQGGGDAPPDVPPETTILVSGRPLREQIDACANLQTLVIPFAGLPAETRLLMQDYPQIAVHNLHHNAPMTAELALSLLLAAAKRTVSIHNTFAQNDWRPRFDAPRNVHLKGRTALILGYGAIGRRIAAVLHALEMTVLAVRRDPGDEDGVYGPDALPDLLPRAHVLMVCLPATPETTGMIGELQLRALPQGAIVVNIGRAAVVDEAALYHALKDGHLYGAGFDVWYSYPPDVESRADHAPSAYPFGDLENMVMSPHRAGGFGADDTEQARMHALAALINAAANGDPLPHPVDLERGY